MISVLGFLIILGPLVVVHEFGHYFFARLFGVRAEIFSIGFGPRVWGKQIGETEWRVSAIPLGGYVKLLGEDREAELNPTDTARALHRQPPWKRFFIFFGGPLFNFLFAIVIFMAILALGEKQMASVVGRVVHHSVAEKAGFQSGDQILKIGDKPVRRFEEVLLALNENPGRQMQFEVQHPHGKGTAVLSVTAGTENGLNVYGEQTRVGEIQGLLPFSRSTHVGVSKPQSVAGLAGLKTGDQIVEWDGTALTNWEELEFRYGQLGSGQAVRLKAVDSHGVNPRLVTFTKPFNGAGEPGADWGLNSSELFIDKTIADSPAEKAGLKSGDRLISIGGIPMRSFFELKEAVQSSGERIGKVTLSWERGGKTTGVTVDPTATAGKDALLNKTTTYTVGIMPMLTTVEPATVVERVWNPFVLLYRGIERVYTLTARNFVSIGKMLGGSVSSKTLGGPIMIGKIAGESLAHGLIAVLTTMAILSIGLGVLNVLPVPVLDGGHLVLLLLESVRGRPLTLKQMEIIQSVGLCLILLLMVLVFKNDISRMTS
ncbi:RIP metalloprotease RseP [Bdellovibrionota bacterium FG-1]